MSRSLADGFVVVVEWYEWIIGGSCSRRMCAPHPKENMRSLDRHYNSKWYEVDDLSSVDP